MIRFKLRSSIPGPINPDKDTTFCPLSSFFPFSLSLPPAAVYNTHSDYFLISEPDVKALRHARHPPDTDGDGV